MKKSLFLFILPGLFLAAQAARAEAPATVAYENPVLLTDVGQGNNARLISAMLRRSKTVEVEIKELAGADQLDGKKTLIVGVGASTKGLGAAGLDVGQEMRRVDALLAAAKERGIPVIGVHVGGESRRGELSDQFNAQVLRRSDVFIVWKAGDEDGFFTRLARTHEVDLRVVDNRIEIGAIIESLFKTE
jgi:hypothetical protein